MKKLLILLIIFSCLCFNCSDTGSDIEVNKDVANDILIYEDISVFEEDVFLNVADNLIDIGFEECCLDIQHTYDYSELFDIQIDTEIKDTINEIYKDVVEDLSPSDTTEDIVMTDLNNVDITVSTDVEMSDADDIDTITDVVDYLTPPELVLLTESPGLDTNIKIGGNAPSGAEIYVFRNKNCSVKPVTVLPTSSFNSNGVFISVNPGSTTYISAYVSDGIRTSACSNFVTYVHHNNAYWHITFFDDFKGFQTGEDPECYSMPPQCIGEYLSGLYECPKSEVHNGLNALNKCNWTILRQPNWMAMEYGPEKNGTNGFTPLEVSVDPNSDNGVLILSANAYKWDGTRLNTSILSATEKNCLSQSQSNWLLHENNSPDCKNVIKYNCVWKDNTINCPILSGAVYSKQFGFYLLDNKEVKKQRGFIQEYGRWEVRAKLPSGMGSFPAHWLLPQSGSWPERGEIDIMESDRYAKESYQTYHIGYCEGSPKPYYPDHQDCTKNGGQRYHLAKSGRLVLRNGSFSDDYHIFAVEWSKDRIDYYTDNILVLSVKEGDLNYGIFTDYYRYTGQARPMNIPFGEFFIILNQTVHNDIYGNISLLNFISQMHKIDYVKVLNVCLLPSDFCKDGFYFDGNDGLCHPFDSSQITKPYQSPCKLKDDLIPKPQPINIQLFYNCTNPCPYGGWFDSSNCHIFISPSNREVFFYPDEKGNMYYVTDGSPNGNCTDTVNGTTFPVGRYDGANCYLDKTLTILQGKYFRLGSPKPYSFYYQPFCKFQ